MKQVPEPTKTAPEHILSLKSIVGSGYKKFWNYTGRYRVVKGSRSSKKSTTTSLWFIYNMMYFASMNMFPNLLVIRKTYRTLQDSCYKQLQWAIHQLRVDSLWQCKQSPLEMTYIPTGQKIYFRGLDDPLKVTSITVSIGQLCWCWIEEAYEINREEDFDMLNEAIRGETPDNLFKQITLTFNPWNEHHWLKSRFFDREDEDTLAMTTNYMCNEWLDDSDIKVFEEMKINNPRRYQVAGLGNWGIVDGLVYENWEEKRYELDSIRNCRTFAGLDFGYTNDPSAFVIGFLDRENKNIYIWDEFYRNGLSNRAIFELIDSMGYRKEKITADSAEPKSIDELKYMGLHIKGAKKGKDSIMNGIQFIQDYHVIIHPRCVNFITEISNYAWEEDKFGKKLNEPIDDFNHLMDAFRYGIEEYIVGNQMLISNIRII